MKLHQEEIEVRQDGDFKAKEATIVASSFAFSVLSKSLYSDPYRAIVRELACNAWDSHVAAGNADKPFEVCLPNALAPTFKVRDYGTGLSEEQVDLVFDYFRSTKQQSNTMTGCFGLGAKSPFAYTHKYTIVSFFNGMKYHYIYVKNERGIPELIKMAEGETDEPNGVEISFAVQPQHYSSFENAAKVALRPFKVHPIVKGLPPYKLEGFFPDKPETLLEGKNWYIVRDLRDYTYYVPQDTPTALMGNVEYPIAAEECLDENGIKTRKGFSKNAQKLLCMNLVIDFPIGSFEITPSRETIQWTEFSVNNINDRLEEIYDEILTLVEQKVSNAPTYWEASILVNEMLDTSALRVLGLHPTWKGRRLNQTLEIPKDFIVTRFSATYPRHDSLGHSKYPNAVQKSQYTKMTPFHTKFMFADYQGSIHRLESYIRHDVPRDYSVMVIQTCTHVMRKTSLPHGAKLAPGAKVPEHEVTVVTYEPNELPKLCEVLGIDLDRIVNISTIPNRERVGEGRKSRLAGSKARAFKFKPTESGKANDLYWDEHEVDLTKPGVYVEINKWRLVAQLCLGTKRFHTAVEYRAVHNSLNSLDITFPGDGLIGVRSADLKKFEKAPGWETLDTFIQREVAAYWNNSTDFQFAYRLAKKTEKHDQYLHTLAHYVVNGHGSVHKWSTKFHEAIKKLHAAQKFSSQTQRFESFKYVLPADVRKALITKDPVVDSLVEDLLERYPILHMLFDNNGYYHHNRAAIAEYTRLIDKEI